MSCLASHSLYFIISTRDPSLAATMLPILQSYRGFSTLGLNQNTLYDVLDDNLGYGNVLVNYHIVNVTCGSITNLSTSPDPSKDFLVVDKWIFSKPFGINDDTIQWVVPLMGK